MREREATPTLGGEPEEANMNGTASELSDALAQAVEAAAESVVRVEGRARGASSGTVWSADGVVVTAHHTLDRDEDVRVGLPDGRSVEATVLGRDPGTDVALLRLSASGLRPAEWRDDAPRTGALALHLARPGRAVRARLGIVSAVAGPWRTRTGGRLDRYFEADVALERGFSGGLFVDAGGRGLGLATAGFIRATPLAVPPATLRRVVEQVLAHGRVRRGYLGIGSYPVALPAAVAEPEGQRSGLMLVSVQDGAPAAAAGLVIGDVILKVEGQPIAHPEDLLPFVDEDRVGAEVAVRILRAGAVREVRVKVGQRDGQAA
jgi:S1-C subfamily serine protease